MRVLTVVTLMIALTMGVAQARPGGEPMSGEPPLPPHELLIDSAAQLGLDEATVAELRAIVEANRAEAEPLLEVAREDAAAQEQLHALGQAMMEEMMALLTEEQRQAAMEIIPPPPSGAR